MSKDPLATVAVGLQFLFAAGVLPVLFIMTAIGTLFAMFALPQEYRFMHSDVQALAWLVAFLVAGGVVNNLLSFFGNFLCLAAPAESRAGELALVAVFVQMLGLLLNGFHSVAAMWPTLLPWRNGVAYVQGGLAIVNLVLFFWFLNRLSRFLGDRRLSREVRAVPIMLVLIAILIGVVLTLGLTGWIQKSDVLLVVFIASVIIGAFLGVWTYVRFLLLLRWGCKVCRQA